MKSTTYLFVGEKPSRKAIEIGATWQSGGLAAKQLHDALRAASIEPIEQEFLNLFGDSPDDAEVPDFRRIRTIRRRVREGYTVVAMGGKVAHWLYLHCVEHRQIIHPAARGRIRRKDRYAAHVAQALQS